MRPRSAARAVALQALYQFDLRGEDFAPELQTFLRDWAADSEVRAYAVLLIEGCRLALDEINDAVSAAAENWDLSRMAAVDRAILRIGAYELLYGQDVPPRVAVDEAIRLAKRFSTDDSGRFINGVLDKIMADAAPGARRGAPPEQDPDD